jgi:hypothetical protein
MAERLLGTIRNSRFAGPNDYFDTFTVVPWPYLELDPSTQNLWVPVWRGILSVDSKYE